MRVRDLPFPELLLILSQAEAIQFDGELVYPAVEDDMVEVTINDELICINEDSLTNLAINNGNIVFEMCGQPFIISVLEHKKLI